MYDKGWEEISPICTRIEKTIAQTLEAAGYNPNNSSSNQSQGVTPNSDNKLPGSGDSPDKQMEGPSSRTQRLKL
jgi:hypothetical protein